MYKGVKRRRAESQRGVALVIAIFTLMLISVMATALILMAGTETALKSNYRSSMQAFYDAKSGLEEARGRLWSANPDSINACVFPAPGTPMPVGRVCYVVNPAGGEVVDPTDLSSTNPYADFEYADEWGAPVTSAIVPPPVSSTSAVAAAGIDGPLYKWVRITPWTERAAKIDTNGDGAQDNNALYLHFDSLSSELHSVDAPAPSDGQILSITALAVTRLGSRRMVQYTIATPGLANLNLTVPAAFTILGPAPSYSANSNSFHVNGNDRSGANPGACGTAPQLPLTGLGVTDDPTPVVNSIPPPRQGNYQGAGGSPPSIANVSAMLSSAEQNVTGLEAAVQTITGQASEVITGPATSLPNYGSAANPVIAVVKGDFNSVDDITGYGLLLVTGNFSANGNFGWRGMVLVIGQGTVNGVGSNGNEFDGALIVAKTRDAAGNLLPTLGNAQVNWGGGNSSRGIYYDSCWINAVNSSFPYRVLSFREIPQLLP